MLRTCFIGKNNKCYRGEDGHIFLEWSNFIPYNLLELVKFQVASSFVLGIYQKVTPPLGRVNAMLASSKGVCRLPWWLSGKESACQCRRLGLIPGSGWSPGGGSGNPLQYSCLGNSMDGGAWHVIARGVAKESDNWETKQQHMAMWKTIFDQHFYY